MPQDPTFASQEKAVLHNQAALAATNVLATALTAITGRAVVTFHVQVLVSVAGVFSAVVTRGGVAVTGAFNGGFPIAANTWQVFTLEVHTDDSVNFQTSVAANISMRVQERYAGVQ